MGENSKDATAKASLSYDTRSWMATLRLLDVRGESRFVLLPWLLFTAQSIGLATARQLYPDFSEILSEVPSVMALGLGSILSLLLAFRLNASYARWSDARSLLGHVIDGTRNLLTQLIAAGAAHQTRLCMPNSDRARAHELHEQVGGWCIAFAVALASHLRAQKLPFSLVEDEPEEEADAMTDRRSDRRHRKRRTLSFKAKAGHFDGLHTLLSTSQLSHLSQSNHPPLYALTRLRHAVEAALVTPAETASAVATPAARQDGASSPTDESAELTFLYPHVAFLSHRLFGVTESFCSALTGCERILRTPLPPGYVGVLRVLMLLFLAVLPFSLLGGLEWGLVPVCSLLSYLLLEVQEWDRPAPPATERPCASLRAHLSSRLCGGRRRSRRRPSRSSSPLVLSTMICRWMCTA